LDDRRRLNLSESLRSTAVELTAAAQAVASLGGDDEDIKRQAEILDRIGDDARESAAILRNPVERQRRAVVSAGPHVAAHAGNGDDQTVITQHCHSAASRRACDAELALDLGLRGDRPVGLEFAGLDAPAQDRGYLAVPGHRCQRVVLIGHDHDGIRPGQAYTFGYLLDELDE
jgi:hypothetical protein